jgi:hypothetical protein
MRSAFCLSYDGNVEFAQTLNVHYPRLIGTRAI